MVYLWLAVASGFCVAGIDGIPQQAIVQDMMQAIEWFKKSCTMRQRWVRNYFIITINISGWPGKRETETLQEGNDENLFNFKLVSN
ncbi:MAG: hypothetical protein AYP45_11360 [Candidatus Brocadia carolinensis]|uniref:Uncharacterized protein n=1 Tax=Candidatus Brocadia carolinensis TaxID=1004156 RepID=A0A1V4ASC2_9BACT|nr:MAG: hypothetical protein AYP45_11360 [Candidatus Brocadia caroliniensis]